VVATRPLPLLLVAALLVACRTADPIPSGAQQVHVAVTRSSVTINPKTVHAGDVYVVLDGPGQSVLFVARKPAAEATPGPMSDDDLDRLSRGDTQATSIEGISVGCSPTQRAAARGKVGYCGNVYKLVLAPGKYAFLLDSSQDVNAGIEDD
jgi:hypothetical protein